jgi:hypothetical protein
VGTDTGTEAGAGAEGGAPTSLAGDIRAERGDSDGEYADPMDDPNGFGPEKLLEGCSDTKTRSYLLGIIQKLPST